MRAMFLIVGSVLLCVGLFGCDRTPQTVQAPVVAATPPCNCMPSAAPPAPVRTVSGVHRHYHHRRHSLAEIESAAYQAERESGGSMTMEREGSSYSESTGAPPPPSAEPPVWVDGYGRAHYAITAEADQNPVRLGAEDRKARRSVWHGYDSNCDE